MIGHSHCDAIEQEFLRNRLEYRIMTAIAFETEQFSHHHIQHFEYYKEQNKIF